MSFWNKILGFTPEIELEVSNTYQKCYKCDSKNVERLNAGPWSGKVKCKDCGYTTYIIYTDRMGGGLTDSVAVDLRDSNI